MCWVHVFPGVTVFPAIDPLRSGAGWMPRSLIWAHHSLGNDDGIFKVYIYIYIPVGPHKEVAAVSIIGNYRRGELV